MARRRVGRWILCASSKDFEMGEGVGVSIGRRNVYLALQRANKQPIQNLTRLVRVTNVLKRLGAVLATDIEHNLLTTAVTMSAYAQSVALDPSMRSLGAMAGGIL
jgi:ABC-type molybdate transport system ATPase subunit